MADPNREITNEDLSKSIARVVWGLLLIWTGAAVLLSWGWGIGLVGAGVILLVAQAVRRRRRLEVDGLGLVAGALFAIGGVGSLLGVSIDLFPVLCILAGGAILVSTWTARTRHATGERAGLQAPPDPRA